MAAELVYSATSKKLRETDWTKNIEICELVARDSGYIADSFLSICFFVELDRDFSLQIFWRGSRVKEVIKSIKKRLGHKNPNVQLFSVMLLETLVNNCGEHVHKQVIENGLLPVLVKIVKRKTDYPVRERIFLLLDATQTAVGGASGKFPEYYGAYYELVSARVKFPQRSTGLPADAKEDEGEEQKSSSKPASDSSIIQKAESAWEVLHQVLSNLDPKNPEGARDEFTLDLVEQCSFQKQRLMHLVMTSRDEKLVSRAIDLNERLHKLLIKHDALLSGGTAPAVSSPDHELVEEEREEEEEDADCLLRRLRKGKACAGDHSEALPRPFGSVNGGRQSRPIARPLCIEPLDSNGSMPAAPLIPPPPSKYVEREKYFKEKKVGEGQTLAGHIRGLSLNSSSIGSSSSSGGSVDLTEQAHHGASNGNRP